MTTPEANASRGEHFHELKMSLQGLAMTASQQPELFPEFVAKADELASSFDHWAAVVRNQHGGELSSTQVDCLAAIGRKLSTMSRDGADLDADLWTESALSSSPHWDEVRRLAMAALDAFGEV
jgi:hypothetical protein